MSYDFFCIRTVTKSGTDPSGATKFKQVIKVCFSLLIPTSTLPFWLCKLSAIHLLLRTSICAGCFLTPRRAAACPANSSVWGLKKPPRGAETKGQASPGLSHQQAGSHVGPREEMCLQEKAQNLAHKKSASLQRGFRSCRYCRTRQEAGTSETVDSVCQLDDTFELEWRNSYVCQEE